MYLRTPKRYTPKGKRRRLINLRWWWLYVLTAVVVVVGAGIWQIRDMLREPIEAAIATQMQAAADQVATMQAPTPTPTDSPINYLVVANAAYERGAVEEAIANYALAAEGMPNDVEVYFRLAHLLITNGKLDEALDAAERAINADPYDPRGWAIRGMAYDWLGEYEEAVASLLHALELDPDSAVAHAFLAEAYLDMRSPDRALEQAEIALSLDPTDFNVQRNYGYVLEWTGDYDSAVEAYRRALQLAPSRTYIAFNLADLYFRQGDYQDGIDLLRAIIDRNPESATAHFKLGVALYQYFGEWEQARGEFERCVSISPDNVSCLSLLGALQRRDGEYNLCARTLDHAIQAGSQNPEDYYLGGTCYLVINDCQRATEILFDGLALTDDPETQADFRDALAQCQVVITLAPTPTSLFEQTATPEAPAQ